MNKEEKNNKELQELKGIDRGVDRLNVWFIINTIATIITGIAALTLTIITIIVLYL